LSGFGPELARVYDEAAARLGRPGHDERVLRLMDAARTYQFIACLSILPELPVIADALKSSIESWRTTPFAAGL
jgi:hypothetical protein